MKLRAVLFDMGGTIETFGYTHELRLKETAEIQRILKGVGIDLGITDEVLYPIISKGLRAYHDFCIESLDEYPPVKVWREYVLKDFDVDLERLERAAEALASEYELNFYFRAMRPEIPAVLEEIRKLGLKIGLISNVNSRGQVPTNLEKYGIKQYFDPIILSSEYGVRKPDPSIFHYAARLINEPTSACLYVGDRVMRDVLGAQRAGYRLAVQIVHDFAHGEDDNGAVPDAVIHDMGELLEIIRADLEKPQPTPPSIIQALFFDAGDILYHRPGKGDKLVQFLKEVGIDLNHYVEMDRVALTQVAYRGQMSQEAYQTAYLRLIGLQDAGLIQRGLEILNDENTEVAYFDGVRETLHALKAQGYLLGIVTDTVNSVRTKLRWFEQGGFGNVWDSIISSFEVGLKKPEAGIFQAGLRHLGVEAAQSVFVGHKPSELEGARQVGMHTVAFNPDQGAQAEYFVDRFADLLTLPLLSEPAAVISGDPR